MARRWDAECTSYLGAIGLRSLTQYEKHLRSNEIPVNLDNFILHSPSKRPCRVEDWRGFGRLPVALVVSFERDTSIRLAMDPSPAPSRSHAACGSPALRAPVHFVSRFMGPIMLELLSMMLLSSESDNHYTDPVARTAIVYSTVSNQSLVAFGSSSNADEPSFLPSRGYMRNIC